MHNTTDKPQLNTPGEKGAPRLGSRPVSTSTTISTHQGYCRRSRVLLTLTLTPNLTSHRLPHWLRKHRRRQGPWNGRSANGGHGARGRGHAGQATQQGVLETCLGDVQCGVAMAKHEVVSFGVREWPRAVLEAAAHV